MPLSDCSRRASCSRSTSTPRSSQGAIKFAEGVYNALAVFAVLIDHIAPDPLRWLSNLGASAKDGVRNHLWTAFKKAVKRWFNEKLEEVLGLGPTVWNLLKKGGISITRIGTMVWEGLKAAIPPTLIQLLIEKLVAMIIPAAGAIMAIIEGLRAAWGTVRRILEAFERFFTFLKAVKTGNAGVQFAEAVAAAAIVVIDFVANWLLMRLRKPRRRDRWKGPAIARRIGQRLRGMTQAVRRGLRGVRVRTRRLARRPAKRPHSRESTCREGGKADGKGAAGAAASAGRTCRGRCIGDPAPVATALLAGYIPATRGCTSAATQAASISIEAESSPGRRVSRLYKPAARRVAQHHPRGFPADPRPPGCPGCSAVDE